MGPLAILIAANPRTIKQSGKVYLQKGRWGFEHNCKSTKLALIICDESLDLPGTNDSNVNCLAHPKHGIDSYIVIGPREVQVEIDIPGTESHINVFAKCLD